MHKKTKKKQTKKKVNQVTGVISGDVTPKDKWGCHTQRQDKTVKTPCSK